MKMYKILTITLIFTFILSSCSSPKVPTTVTPTEEPPCLTVGATYGGPIMDAGYNQAMHEAIVAIKQNIPCVKIIEVEKVFDEAAAKITIENLISQGAKLIFATLMSYLKNIQMWFLSMLADGKWVITLPISLESHRMSGT
jgi:basic membrane lipoprotein Med (substrate-binding protein (PBP1-ABC) superfamily)